MQKCILSFILFLFTIIAQATPINKLVFFGDSLSDNGNIYRILLHLMPKSPPYYYGRFTNGPTWAEKLGDYYYHENYAQVDNYAYGGATTILHVPSAKFIAPTLLPIEVDLYLLEHMLQTK